MFNDYFNNWRMLGVFLTILELEISRIFKRGRFLRILWSDRRDSSTQNTLEGTLILLLVAPLKKLSFYDRAKSR